ncbi:MAG: anthranilate synthase component I family protein [Candidatus Walczuchella monophlebidarum]
MQIITTKKKISIICIQSLAEIIVCDRYIYKRYPDDTEEKIKLKNSLNAYKFLAPFFYKFRVESGFSPYSGLYGYITSDSIPFFENIIFTSPSFEEDKVPKIRLGFFKNLIVFDHFHNKLIVIEHRFVEKEDSQMEKIFNIIHHSRFINFPFKRIGNDVSNLTDDQYRDLVSKGIKACVLGQVFQIVLSRQYSQKFKGDEFNVYRTLRSINPSPYLFYFDYGNYKIFGSSPESQIVISNNTASIYPIAGTMHRSGDYTTDKNAAEILAKSTKENSEHVMLVDLARNDLSKTSEEVKVNRYKEIQYFSHVMHMISQVSGKLKDGISSIKVFGESFPSGTLSGAPKYKAMELIDNFENKSRGVYGGAIGFFGLNGEVNTAIIIRSFLSKNNMLFLQAGAGIIADSKEENELEEVNNKLEALKQAILCAENI